MLGDTGKNKLQPLAFNAVIPQKDIPWPGGQEAFCLYGHMVNHYHYDF